MKAVRNSSEQTMFFINVCVNNFVVIIADPITRNEMHKVKC